MRKIPEWIGATDDTPVPARVKLRVFDAHNGRCHISGMKISPGDKWEVEHVTPIWQGGENRESNLAPALSGKHRKKTADEAAMRAKDRRVRKKHFGIHESRSPLPGSRKSRFKRKITGEVVRRDED